MPKQDKIEITIKNVHLDKDKERLEKEFLCMICWNIVIEPMECIGCDNIYCGSCISLWIKKNNRCPMCNI